MKDFLAVFPPTLLAASLGTGPSDQGLTHDQVSLAKSDPAAVAGYCLSLFSELSAA